MQETIGNFRILEKLGEGGMGEVYKGLDTTLEREVAIKLLRPEVSSQPNILERFRTEAVALARLNHPNIAMLHAFHQDSGRAYMIMEYVPGETLGQILARESRLPWQRALELTCQVLCGLGHAHARNIVHRDIKPSNIMLAPDGTIKLMDFGIARVLERSRLTKTGFLVGTLHYMSPEQIQGKETDRRSDIYSVGLVLYKMLTGHAPFDKETDYDTIKAQVEQHPGSLSTWVPEIDPRIDRAVLRSLAKNPSDRFDSAEDFRQTLLAFRSDEGPGRTAFEILNTAQTELLIPTDAKRKIRKRQVKPATVLIGLLVAAGFGALLWLFFDQYPQTERGNRPPEVTDQRAARAPEGRSADDQASPSAEDNLEPGLSVSESPLSIVSGPESSSSESSDPPTPEAGEADIADSKTERLEASERIAPDLNPDGLKTSGSEPLNSATPRAEETETDTATLNFPLPEKSTRKPITTFQPEPKAGRSNRLPLVDMPSR